MSIGIFNPGDRNKQGVPLDCLPERCDCVEAFGDMNRHRLKRVRNDKGVIKFCPVSRRGWIQFDGSGIILDGVFRGDADGD